MKTTSTEDQFDDYVADRISAHTAAIRAALIAGDDDMIATIDDALGAMLFDRARWSVLIQATARGEDKFAALMGEAIHDCAEILALKDVERGEKSRAASGAEMRIKRHEFDCEMRISEAA